MAARRTRLEAAGGRRRRAAHTRLDAVGSTHRHVAVGREVVDQHSVARLHEQLRWSRVCLAVGV